METSSGLVTLIDVVESLLLQYAELVTDGLPPRGMRLVQSNEVEWRNLNPSCEDEEVEGEMVIEVRFREVTSIPEGSPEEVIKDVFSRVSIDDVTFNLSFSALTGMWLFSYYPETEIGIEVRGRRIEDVLGTVIDIMRKRIAFAMGDVEFCVKDLDRELLEMVGFKENETPWF
jgi:hypothetical protein